MSSYRPAALALVVGAMLLAGPALAQSAAATPGNAMSEHDTSAASHEESIDQRISTLHSELQITPSEEADWKQVAQTMRDNAEAMEKLASEKSAASDKGMTAIEDLQTYTEFAQAHVEHLKKLTASFEKLYNSMPQPQRKIADEVFDRSRREHAAGQG